ncbi:MAG: 4Fe-4S ferredoxin, partial [Treponema sp.]|nr:4Fe-4S ferredoxin [Treponema sp.]
MDSTVFFSDMAYSAYEAEQTLPSKLVRQLKVSGLGKKVKNKKVAIKIHVGSEIGYSTIPPVFMRLLADFVKENGGDCFFTDHYIAS